MIVLLSGQIKNIGDFLITDRARKLFEEFVDKDIVILDRTKDLTPQLDVINKARFLVLCGGPAYAQDIYKGIYPLVEDLSKIEVPIIPFGLGWCGRPFNDPEKFKFDSQSMNFLNLVHEKIDNSSCRDIVTQAILKNNGFENVIMTGCPVWYDLESIGQPLVDRTIKNIVFTTPASIRHIWQSTKLLKLTRKVFPEANIVMTFHRGIWPDKYTSIKSGLGYIVMCLLAKTLVRRIEIRDVSYDLNKIDFYKNCDFHIGYRVHAHLYFLSKRLPSILINEDGRGVGMVKSLGMEVLNVDDKDLYSKIERTLVRYANKDFSDFEPVIQKIEDTFKIMKDFLLQIDKKHA